MCVSRCQDEEAGGPLVLLEGAPQAASVSGGRYAYFVFSVASGASSLLLTLTPQDSAGDQDVFVLFGSGSSQPSNDLDDDMII